tara:strand:- start:742 stop:1011 length:270 start_codon:yes stop_codon:yes gene_type:complete
MYTIELSIRFTPFPISVQRKTLSDAQKTYQSIQNCIKGNSMNTKTIELSCEKIQSKQITVLVDQIVAVQLFEKSSGSGGMKKPGFDLER